VKRLYCATAAVATVLLAGCAASESPLAGLPSPVPDGVTFHEPPDTAPPAPDFELELVNGEVVDAASMWSERPMVLVFFESWCELCGDQQQAINELADEYEDIVLFLGVAGLSSESEVIEYVRDNDVSYPVGIDTEGDIWLDYAAAEPPLVALVTKGGKVARGWPGGIGGDRLREQIEDVLVKDVG
jgi:peroxiredoxin